MSNARLTTTNIINNVEGPKKVSTVLVCEMVRHDPKTGKRVFNTTHLRSKTHAITTDINATLAKMTNEMLENLAKYQNMRSGWMLHAITKLEIFITKYEPLRGKGYTVPLPEKLKGKRSIINMQNTDNECFKWAITRALNPTGKNPARVTKELREQAKKYNWDVEFPTKVKNIHKWEIVNSIGVNVFGYDEDKKKLYTIRVCDQELYPSEIANLYLHDDNHYCAISNLSGLVSAQLSKKEHGKDICLRCLNAFGRLTKKEKEEGKESLL